MLSVIYFALKIMSKIEINRCLLGVYITDRVQT